MNGKIKVVHVFVLISYSCHGMDIQNSLAMRRKIKVSTLDLSGIEKPHKKAVLIKETPKVCVFSDASDWCKETQNRCAQEQIPFSKRLIVWEQERQLETCLCSYINQEDKLIKILPKEIKHEITYCEYCAISASILFLLLCAASLINVAFGYA